MGEKGEEKLKKVIIAMKGHPGTGKSTLAQSLASTLKIPLLDKDDIKDSTLTLQQTLNPSSSSIINDLSYDAMWRIASTQLRIGLSVIIDSPLSRKSHLDRLAGLASVYNARLMVVECKPLDKSLWRQRLERRGGGWHKPSTWRDLERLVEGYGGCHEYDFGCVPKLVVDTTSTAAATEELVSSVVEFIVSICGAAIACSN